jgi:ribonuclease HII
MREGPDMELERRMGGVVCGIDEAGRGPWAGPVVAAAVILDPARVPRGIDDSKRLRPAAREELFQALLTCASIGVGAASVNEIDSINILQATMRAMERALAALPRAPGAALVDGNRLPVLPCRAAAVVGGDRRSLSIAAASIVAKVTRDRMMRELSRDFPAYGWERNKGYGTSTHAAALARHGVSPHHRLSFGPVHRAKTQHIDLSY